MPSSLLKTCLTFYLAKYTVDISSLQQYCLPLIFICFLADHSYFGLFFFPTRRLWCSNSHSEDPSSAKKLKKRNLRGPYNQYLSQPGLKIPRKTLRRWPKNFTTSTALPLGRPQHGAVYLSICAVSKWFILFGFMQLQRSKLLWSYWLLSATSCWYHIIFWQFHQL